MKTSLAQFLKVAITTIILTTLLIGAVYQTLSNKNTEHRDILQTEHQIQEN